MAYTLKSTGTAAKAKVVVAVDSDGSIKGWTTPGAAATLTSGSGLTIHANVVTGTDTWQGATKSYFETKGATDPEGIYFPTNVGLTTRTNNKGYAWFGALAGHSGTIDSTPPTFCQLSRDGATSGAVAESIVSTNASPTKIAMIVSSGARGTSTTTIPNDGTTQFSIGAQYMNSGTYAGIAAGGNCWYGADGTAGSSITAMEPASPTGSGFGYNGVLEATGVGGAFQPEGSGTAGASVAGTSAPAKWFVWAVFDDLLELTEYQALHDDWLGTLFESGASAVATSLLMPRSVAPFTPSY